MVNKFRIRKVPLILTKYILLNNSQVSHTASELVREALGPKKKKKKAWLRRPRWQKTQKGLTAYQEGAVFSCEEKSQNKQMKNSHLQITL